MVASGPGRRQMLQRALKVGNQLSVKLIPLFPDRLKTVLAGGRMITVDGNTLDPTLQLLLTAQRAAGVTGLSVADDAAATRAANRELTKALDQSDIRVGAVDAVSIPGPAGAIPARHYRPPTGQAQGRRAAALLVYYHGGGFVFGDLESHDSVCRMVCRDAGIHVLAVDYRLAPEHPAPAAVDDAYSAYLWARQHAADLGADPNRVAVGGDSAGGGLAAVVAREARDAGVPVPSLQWLIYPVTDFRGLTRSRSLVGEGFLLTKHDMEWFQETYLRGSDLDPTDPRVSPLLAEDLGGLPPALVVTAGFDPLRDEGAQYAEKLREAGVVVDHRQMGSMTHAFANLNVFGGGVARANAEMISALRAHLTHD